MPQCAEQQSEVKRIKPPPQSRTSEMPLVGGVILPIELSGLR